MPPVHPPLKNDGPACRVCGCTEHNACVISTDETFTERIAKAVRIPATRMPRLLTCSWVKIADGRTLGGPLCSACAGTEADMIESLKRITLFLEQERVPSAHLIGVQALARHKKRQKGA